MTEAPRGNFSHLYTCKAEIDAKLPREVNVAEGTMVCRGDFCKGMKSRTIYALGDTPNEALLRAEFALRGIVRDYCPQWKAIKENGLAPGESKELPDDYMPPFK